MEKKPEEEYSEELFLKWAEEAVRLCNEKKGDAEHFKYVFSSHIGACVKFIFNIIETTLTPSGMMNVLDRVECNVHKEVYRLRKNLARCMYKQEDE